MKLGSHSRGTRSRRLLPLVILVLLTVSIFAVSAYAGVAYNGGKGLLRTRAADTIGKGRLEFALSSNASKLNDQKFFLVAPTDSAIVDYWFFISRVGLTYGLGEFAEISGSLDIRNWIRKTQVEPTNSTLDTQTRGGLGDTDVSIKLSAPLPNFIKLGAQGTFTFSTGNKERGFSTDSRDILALGLLTLDFTEMDSFVPTRLHVNAGYRWNRNETR
ncbi:MAG: hypothetical protein IH969_07625, partial [Candidatus Krumholzibacteriota bacterium]|nr:hypothetical protein [Candidatus Krumholzibacteriota bacterium]